MKHAYCIIAHQDPLMLHVLVAMLDHPQNDVFIHVDKKVDIEPFLGAKTRWSNVVYLKDRISVEWGSTSQIDGELLLFDYALYHGDYSYFHLMSGLDLPLQSQDYIHDFMDNKNPGREFVTVNRKDEELLRDLEYKTRYYHFFVRNLSDAQHSFSHYWYFYLHAVTIKIQQALGIRRKYPFELRKGSNWVSISQQFVAYMLSEKNKLKSVFRKTLCADEIFLQTLLWNSPFREKLHQPEDKIHGNVRNIKWVNHKPYVWKKDDYESLISSRKLFARKFTSQDKELLLLIAKHNGCLEAVQAILAASVAH